MIPMETARELSFAKLRIAELERVTRGQNAILNEIAEAAGFTLGQTYSAFSLIDALRRQGSATKNDGRSAECA